VTTDSSASRIRVPSSGHLEAESKTVVRKGKREKVRTKMVRLDESQRTCELWVGMTSIQPFLSWPIKTWKGVFSGGEKSQGLGNQKEESRGLALSFNPSRASHILDDRNAEGKGREKKKRSREESGHC